jgi:hypothetical protein
MKAKRKATSKRRHIVSSLLDHFSKKHVIDIQWVDNSDHSKGFKVVAVNNCQDTPSAGTTGVCSRGAAQNIKIKVCPKVPCP